MKKNIIRVFLFLLFIAITANTCIAQGMYRYSKFKDVSCYEDNTKIVYTVFISSATNSELTGLNNDDMLANAKSKRGYAGSKPFYVFYFSNLNSTPSISQIGLDFKTANQNKYFWGAFAKEPSGGHLYRSDQSFRN